MKHLDDIRDDEIRLIEPKGRNRNIFRKWWFWIAVLSCVIVIVLTVMYFCNNDGVNQTNTPLPVAPNIIEDKLACVTICDTTINDVSMRLFTPQNAKPEMCVGAVDTTDYGIILAFEAADIRADNGQIVGDFVLNGKIMSNGKAKKAFCAIIDGKTYIDNSEDSPLLEEAIEKQGCFFRQYPLVMNGIIQENKPKGKAIRSALCEKDGIIMVISTVSRESFYDFAQALADFGVNQAIYLKGSNSFGFCRTVDSTFSWGECTMCDEYAESVNFILWKSINK